jgi:hypothetical protein
MIAPAVYILRVPANRRAILLDDNVAYYGSGEFSVAEPVSRFEHSSRAPLIVFCCFKDNVITHVADGRKGASAGTGLVRLNLTNLEPLAKPVPFSSLVKRMPARLRNPLSNKLYDGGKLPPKTLASAIDVMLKLEPGLEMRLARFSERRAKLLTRLTNEARANLAAQKESVTTALEIAGIDTRQVLTWTPAERPANFFLEGMPQAVLREDAVLASDFSQIPGFEAIRELPFAARVFESESSVYPRTRLKVIMANRLELEQQTGADLIYFNETFRSFVMVQYKAMERGKRGPEFRWRDRDQLHDEILRMDALLKVLRAEPEDATPGSFRLHTNPFFLKLCPRLVFNPDDKGLSRGMYLPLEYWKSLALAPATVGPRGGRRITYENVGRKLTNSDFVTLVAGAWVGTTVPQSIFLEKVVESVLQTGKTVTLAVKSEMSSPYPYEDDESDLDQDSWDEETLQ